MPLPMRKQERVEVLSELRAMGLLDTRGSDDFAVVSPQKPWLDCAIEHPVPGGRSATTGQSCCQAQADCDPWKGHIEAECPWVSCFWDEHAVMQIYCFLITVGLVVCHLFLLKCAGGSRFYWDVVVLVTTIDFLWYQKGLRHSLCLEMPTEIHF